MGMGQLYPWALVMSTFNDDQAQHGMELIPIN